jgi:hypothetical protein
MQNFVFSPARSPGTNPALTLKYRRAKRILESETIAREGGLSKLCMHDVPPPLQAKVKLA